MRDRCCWLEAERGALPDAVLNRPYNMAQREHAFLLWCEGPSLIQIGRRLGVSSERVRQLILAFGKRLHSALRRTRFRYVPSNRQETDVMTMEEARQQAIQELLEDDDFSYREIADAKTSGDSYLHNLIEALAQKYLDEDFAKVRVEEDMAEQKAKISAVAK
jgi:hypothetical protein